MSDNNVEGVPIEVNDTLRYSIGIDISNSSESRPQSDSANGYLSDNSTQPFYAPDRSRSAMRQERRVSGLNME